MGERESLYGGLDRSTVYTAQSVLQLQKLLQWRTEKNSNLLVRISRLMHPRTPVSIQSVVHRQGDNMIRGSPSSKGGIWTSGCDKSNYENHKIIINLKDTELWDTRKKNLEL